MCLSLVGAGVPKVRAEMRTLASLPPNDALAQPQGGVEVATGSLGNVSKRMFETLAEE